MIDEVLSFWFGEPAKTTEEYGRKIRRWFMGGPALDAEIRDRFGALVERALAGELDDWAQTTRGRQALIVLLDQFTRSIYRNDPRTYAGDAKAQALATEALDRGLDRGLSIEERQFLMMPLMHAEDPALQERCVETIERITADAAEFQKPLLAMAVEQAHKYRDVIARFGGFRIATRCSGGPARPLNRSFSPTGQPRWRPRAPTSCRHETLQHLRCAPGAPAAGIVNRP